MTCNKSDYAQCWAVLSDGSYVMVESYEHMGKCIAVDYEEGDSREILADSCSNGILMLKDCDSKYGTEWYFTGGQLISSVCWAAGVSTLMTVFVDGNNGQCDSRVSVWGDAEDAILRADTFMFVTRLPEAPFQVDLVTPSPITSPTLSPTPLL